MVTRSMRRNVCVRHPSGPDTVSLVIGRHGDVTLEPLPPPELRVPALCNECAVMRRVAELAVLGGGPAAVNNPGATPLPRLKPKKQYGPESDCPDCGDQDWCACCKEALQDAIGSERYDRSREWN